MENERIKNYVYVCLSTIVMSLFAYFNVIKSFFLSDDFTLIEAIIHNGKFAIWTVNANFFRPIISLSLFVDHFFYGLNATGYHITNIIIHGLNAFLVFLITDLILESVEQKDTKSQQQKISFFACMIFLVLPSHTEAVSWISGRTDIIATFFCLCSFFLYLLYTHVFSYGILIICSLAFFMLALLSKESILTYPFVLASYEIYMLYAQKKQVTFKWNRLILLMYYIFTLLIFIGIRWKFVGEVVGGYGNSVHLDIRPVKFFLYAIFFSFRAYLPPLQMQTWYIILPSFLLSVVVVFIFLIRQRGVKRLWQTVHPLIYFLVVTFFVALLPGFSLGIMPMDTRGERILYLSSVFSSILLSYIIVKILSRYRKTLWGVSLGLLGFFQIFLHNSNTQWKLAGEIARDILLDIQKIEVDNIEIINLPDNLRGAYIYRNGIQQAVSIFLNNEKKKQIVNALSYQYLQTPDDKVLITQHPSIGSYHIQIEHPEAYFIDIDVSDDKYRITDTVKKGFRRYPKSYELYFKEVFNKCELYFYSERQLHSICRER